MSVWMRTPSCRRTILALVTVWLATPIPAVAQQGRAEKEAATDALFEAWNRIDSPGCSVGIIEDGQLIFTRGYGSANLDYGVPLDETSVFYIASTSKQFTAAAIARLALDAELSLDDEIQEYVPEIPRYEWPVTIRHLVHHTSGIRDYLALMQMARQNYENYWDNDSGIEFLSRQKALNFQPGSEYLYSNSGYILLAEIVERVTGKTLQEYTFEEFFAPLEMSATTWGEDYAAVIPNRVVSYDRRPRDAYRTWLKHFHGKGDGNLLTTVEDLAQWDRMFYETDGRWAELTELALTRGVLNDGTELEYAFGLGRGEYRGLEITSHAGGMLGFRTQFIRFPAERFSVICLCNLGHINPGDLSLELADIWLFESEAPEEDEASPTGPEATEESEAWEPDASELERFVGSFYSQELDVSYAIELRGGEVYLVQGDDSTRLRPFEPHVLAIDPRGFNRLEFEPGTGLANGFTVSSGRVRGIVFERR
ncbi:MAG: beta-lactamase family protein [Gemmatimonadota bacterium]|nr:beta-lactamase family protein [Gemmatimonadota bacterium]